MTSKEKNFRENPFTIEQFYKFLQNKKLMGAKCNICNFEYVPPRPICSNCYSKDLNWFQLEKQGKLLTYTIIQVAPKRFESWVPYVYGIVGFNRNIKLPGIIRGIEFHKLRIGLELKIDFDVELSEDWPMWPRYFFHPP